MQISEPLEQSRGRRSRPRPRWRMDGRAWETPPSCARRTKSDGASGINARKAFHGALLVASIGLALHLVFPQIPRIESSLRLISDTSHLLVGTAFVAEVLRELCYAELLGRSVKTVSGPGYSSRLKRCRGIERWFMLRLTVTSYGGQLVLRAGGAVATTMNFRLLRRRGLDLEKGALALGGLSVLVYGALGILFAGRLAYLLLMRALGPVFTSTSILPIVLVLPGPS